MKLSDYKPPFQAQSTCEENMWMVADSRSIHLCSELKHSEAVELCSILNAHFEKKEEPNPGGICDKCLSIHSPAFIGQTCICSKNCGGTVQDIHTPQPNREETDRVAAEYYKSGRKLEVQYFNTVNGWCVTSHPQFDYSLAWRLTPKRRRVVVDVFAVEYSPALLFSESGSDGAESFRKDKACKLLGTIEGEVEA